MLINSMFCLILAVVYENPLRCEPELRTSDVVVQEIRKLLAEIDASKRPIDEIHLAIANGLVNSQLPVNSSLLGEYCIGQIWSGRAEEALKTSQDEALNFDERKTITYQVALELILNKRYDLIDKLLQVSEFADTVLEFAYTEAYKRGDEETCEWIQSKKALSIDRERLFQKRLQHKNKFALLEVIGFQFYGADLDNYCKLVDSQAELSQIDTWQREVLNAMISRSKISDEVLMEIKREDESSPILLKYRLIHEGITALEGEFPQWNANQSFADDQFRKKVVNWFCIQVELDHRDALFRLAKFADMYLEKARETESIARKDWRIHRERNAERITFRKMITCMAIWIRQNCDAKEVVSISRNFSVPELQLEFLISALSDY